MTELDVHQIICPIRDRELEQAREWIKGATAELIQLRTRLAIYEPDSPDPYNGVAWYERLNP